MHRLYNFKELANFYTQQAESLELMRQYIKLNFQINLIYREPA